MGDVEKGQMAGGQVVAVELSPALVAEVRSALGTSENADLRDVVEQALEQWLVRHALQDQRIRVLYEEGRESGDFQPLNYDEFLVEMQAEVRQEQTQRQQSMTESGSAAA